MPAILRNSLPKDYALITVIGPYAVYDRVGVGRAGSVTVSQGARGMWVCNIMPCVRCEYAGVAMAAGHCVVDWVCYTVHLYLVRLV